MHEWSSFRRAKQTRSDERTRVSGTLRHLRGSAVRKSASGPLRTEGGTIPGNAEEQRAETPLTISLKTS